MKKAIFLGILVIAITSASGQGPVRKGQAQLNAGLGFSSWGIPVYFGFDIGVHEDITVGGGITFRSYNDNYKGVNYVHSIFSLVTNGNYHFNSLLDIPANWDFYAGLNLGLYFWNSPEDYPGNHSSGLGLGAQIGGRYYFNDKFGINLEIGGGYSLSGGRFGISIRL